MKRMNDELLIKLQDVFRRVLNQPGLVIARELLKHGERALTPNPSK